MEPRESRRESKGNLIGTRLAPWHAMALQWRAAGRAAAGGCPQHALLVLRFVSRMVRSHPIAQTDTSRPSASVWLQVEQRWSSGSGANRRQRACVQPCQDHVTSGEQSSNDIK